jgi:hypothetical protein
MYGTRFLRSADELPEGVPASQFDVNDDGLLVWVGENGSYRDHQWGTSTTLNATPTTGACRSCSSTRAAARTSSASATATRTSTGACLQRGVWRDFTFYGLLGGQVGGNIYNRTKQRMYQYLHSGDADQSGKPDELKKVTDYYDTSLYAGNLINEWFVEDASFVKLRELSLRWRVPQGASTVSADSASTASRSSHWTQPVHVVGLHGLRPGGRHAAAAHG